jgi:hypothetical protein
MMFNKINTVVLEQVRETVKQFGSCYLHGDGQFYGAGKEKNSDDNKEFSDPDNLEATYRVLFTSPEQVPDKLEDIENMLHTGKIQETTKSREPSERVETQIVKMPDTEPEAKKKAGRPAKTA